jgi:hypothetical protein
MHGEGLREFEEEAPTVWKDFIGQEGGDWLTNRSFSAVAQFYGRMGSLVKAMLIGLAIAKSAFKAFRPGSRRTKPS